MNELKSLKLQSKLPHVGTTIFAVMSALANETGAINLSQGFPNFPASEELISLVYKYMKQGMNQYAPMQGVMSLREVLVDKMQKLYGIKIDAASEINITSGGTQAIYTAIASLIKNDDEVIVIEPAYDCYVPAIEIHGGKPVYTQLKAPDFRVDWAHLRSLITSGTRMIMINTPHNPTGAIMTKEDMHELEKTVEGTDIIILSDEVYEHIIFDNLKHESVLLHPKLAERSFVIYSFGKTYHTTGWKMGYVISPASLMKEFRKVHQFNVFTSNTPIQHALSEYISKSADYSTLPSFYQKKRDYFISLIKGSKFQYKPASGSYFQLLDYSNITQEKDTDFATRMTREFGVASIPTSVFYGDGLDQKLLRFCFAKTDETLEKAAERLLKVQ